MSLQGRKTIKTMNKHQLKGPSASCAKKTMFGGFTEVGKQAILDKHNELRRKIAKGEEKGMPPAANMKKIVG